MTSCLKIGNHSTISMIKTTDCSVLFWPMFSGFLLNWLCLILSSDMTKHFWGDFGARFKLADNFFFTKPRRESQFFYRHLEPQFSSSQNIVCNIWNSNFSHIFSNIHVIFRENFTLMGPSASKRVLPFLWFDRFVDNNSILLFIGCIRPYY